MDWLRLHHGTCPDPKWRIVSRRAKEPVSSVLAVWLAMLECASQSEPRGILQNWNDEVIGVMLDLEKSQVQAIRDAMQGMVLDGDQLTGWNRRQPKRERETPDNSTERVRRHRERHETPRNDGVTPCNATERQKQPREEESREEKIDGGVVTPACTHEAQPEPAAPPPADKPDPRAHIPLWKSVLTVMGVIDDPRWSGSGHLCATWVKQGIPDEIILGTITAEMAKLRQRGQGPPASLKYFDRAIAQAHADSQRPMPEPDHARPSPPPVARTGRQYGSGYTQDDLRRSIVAGIAGGLDPGGTVAGEDQPSGRYRAASAV